MNLKARIPRIEICNEFKGTEEECQALEKALQSPEYWQATTFRDQIGHLCKFLRAGPINVSYERIGQLFNESKHTIWDQYQNYLKGDRPDGRPASLTEKEQLDVANYIQTLHSATNPIFPTYNDISFYITNKFNKTILDDTLRHIIKNKFGHLFKIITAKAQEDGRFYVCPNEIEENLNLLASEVNGVPPDFVFNLDEVGCHDFADAHDKYVIAPITYDESSTTYPVTRQNKRCSAIVCISLNGLACRPQITIPRVTVDSQIYKYIPPSSFQIASSSSGFVNTETFSLWIKYVFLPHLHNLRQQTGYRGRAVMILDGYLPHKNSLSQIDLQGENLIIHYLVPHSSNQTQPLDLVIFGLMKRFMNDFKTPEKLTAQSKQLFKIHQAIYRCCTPITCRSAFRAIGVNTKHEINGSQWFEIAIFNLLSISKVQCYQISYIQELINNGKQLTPNQLFIYQKSSIQQTDDNQRIRTSSLH